MDRSVVRSIAAALGLVTVVLGAWAFVSPRSFFDQLAMFPPYNPHLLHDVGAFQVGLGAVLILAVLWRDPLSVALVGVGSGFVLHWVSHVIDRDLGGRSTDPLAIGLLAALLVVAAVLHRRRRTTIQRD